jgi:hypothetical protein
MPNNEELFALIEKESPQQSSVDLNVIRKKAAELRDNYLRKADLENQLNVANQQITHIERHELIDMFNEAHISSITVDAEGNHPPFIAERATVYTAKIPDEKRQDAFQWFESQGYGDLIKSVINIVFGMQEHERRLEVMKLLDSHHIEYYTNESVHHQTLKAFVKREIQSGHTIPHDLLGVYVFDEVKIK